MIEEHLSNQSNTKVSPKRIVDFSMLLHLIEEQLHFSKDTWFLFIANHEIVKVIHTKWRIQFKQFGGHLKVEDSWNRIKVHL